MKRLHGLILGGVAVVLLSGCDQVGNPWDVIQGKVRAPDEFEVVARKPLRMPNSLNLPVPRLGEPSPLDPTPKADAVAALLGTTPTPNGAQVSQGEAALLAAANARANDSQIRQILEEDKDRVDDSQPYEAPSLVTLLFGEDDDAPEDALDPAAEARRLSGEGIAKAPVDPNDTGSVERKATDPEGVSRPAFERRPNNQLNAEGTPAIQ